MARMTYIGSCLVNNVLIPCTNMNSGIENSIQFYDHVVGLRDKDYTGTSNKGPEIDEDKAGGYKNIQKKIYRRSPSIFKGKFSGPIAIDATGDINIKNLIEFAIKGTEIDQIDFIYISSPDGTATKEGHQIKNVVVESLKINVNASDIAFFDIGVVAKNKEDVPTYENKNITCCKLLTWDKCTITSALTGDIQAFSIDIKNTIIPIYTSGPESDYSETNYYAPTALRLGMQEVTGNIGTYGFNIWKNNADILKFKLGDNNEWSLHILYNPTQSSGSGSNEPYVSATPFVGASDTAVFIA